MKKNSRPEGFAGKSCPTFNEEFTPIHLKFFQKIEKEGTLPNLFYEVSMILIPKRDKDSIRKENFTPIFLINVEEIFSNKILVCKIQQNIKGSYTMITWYLSLGCKNDSIYINQ